MGGHAHLEPVVNPPDFAIITPSYRNDCELAAELCRSIDQHVRGAYHHFLIVPQRDLALFAALASPARTVLTQESLLRPHGLFRLPLPRRLRLPPLLDRRVHDQWWCRGVGRVSGWFAQQLVKLASADITQAQNLLFIDSDIVLFRPLALQSLHTRGRLNLHQGPLQAHMTEHRRWLHIARELLGLAGRGPELHNYVGPVVAWRRANLLLLHERIAALQSGPWMRTVLRQPTLSEYMLYGVFCTEVLGDAGGHRVAASRLTRSVWTVQEDLAPEHIARGVLDDHVALLVQSTIPISAEQRRRILHAVQAKASSRCVPAEHDA
jgi:Family of unknown function (DUF6492)